MLVSSTFSCDSHANLACTLHTAAALADRAMASPKRFIHLVVDEEGRFEVVLDQWRDLSIHLARLSVALERPVVERRGRRRPKPPRGRVRERAAAYGVDVARLEAGIHRTVEQRLVRLDENLAFVNAARLSRSKARAPR